MKQAQVLNDKDIKRVLAAIAKRSYSSRDRAMFMLSLLAGMRVGEIAALKIYDVYEADGSVKDSIRLTKDQTKGSEARSVLLNAAIGKAPHLRLALLVGVEGGGQAKLSANSAGKS